MSACSVRWDTCHACLSAWACQLCELTSSIAWASLYWYADPLPVEEMYINRSTNPDKLEWIGARGSSKQEGYHSKFAWNSAWQQLCSSACPRHYNSAQPCVEWQMWCAQRWQLQPQPLWHVSAWADSLAGAATGLGLPPCATQHSSSCIQWEIWAWVQPIPQWWSCSQAAWYMYRHRGFVRGARAAPARQQ